MATSPLKLTVPWLGPAARFTPLTPWPLMCVVRSMVAAALKAVDALALDVVGAEGATSSVMVSLPPPPPKLPWGPLPPIDEVTEATNVSVPEYPPVAV